MVKPHEGLLLNEILSVLGKIAKEVSNKCPVFLQ
jgi:hypothetical protein